MHQFSTNLSIPIGIDYAVTLIHQCFALNKKKNVLEGNNYIIGQNNSDFHAEEYVLNMLIQNFKSNLLDTLNTLNTLDIELYVIRTNKKNELKNSKPCQRCINFMINFTKINPINIVKICYSGDDGIVETTLDELSNDPNKHIPKSEKQWYKDMTLSKNIINMQ